MGLAEPAEAVRRAAAGSAEVAQAIATLAGAGTAEEGAELPETVEEAGAAGIDRFLQDGSRREASF
jgi:hypothetical protein